MLREIHALNRGMASAVRSSSAVMRNSAPSPLRMNSRQRLDRLPATARFFRAGAVRVFRRVGVFARDDAFLFRLAGVPRFCCTDGFWRVVFFDTRSGR